MKKIINSRNRFWIKHPTEKNQTQIENVTIISRNSWNIVRLYREASMLAICLTPSALRHSVRAIGRGLIERYRLTQKPLKILVLMNLPDSAAQVKYEVNRELNACLQDTGEIKKINQIVQFIPTVADRIVTKISGQEIRDQIRKQLLSVMPMNFSDKNLLNQKIEYLMENPEKLSFIMSQMNLECCLFMAEKNFFLYAPKLPVVSQFPGIQCVENVSYLQTIKNKFINGPHAILAWLGALFGCKTIAESIRLPGMMKFLENMMEDEIAPVLMKACPGLLPRELEFQKKLFLKRCEESTEDPVSRVGRDPLRKINSGERIRGTIELANQLLPSMPVRSLYYGIAAAILYALKKCDLSNPECRQIRKIYCNNYLCEDILTWNGSTENIHFNGFDPVRDACTINNILQYVAILERQCKIRKNTDNFFFETKHVS